MNKILTYYSKIKNYNEEDKKALLNELPAKLKEKVIRLDNIDNKKASFFGFELLKKALKLNGIDIYEYEYSFGEYGKPCLVDCDLKFSLSHSHGLCIVSLSQNEVGADVEKISDRSLKIDRLFTKKEKEYIEKSENPICSLYEIWTSKEAFSKEGGRGLSIPLNSFETLDISYNNLVHFIIDESFIASVYSKEPSIFEEPKEIEI